jgi:hypothetical protein
MEENNLILNKKIGDNNLKSDKRLSNIENMISNLSNIISSISSDQDIVEKKVPISLQEEIEEIMLDKFDIIFSILDNLLSDFKLLSSILLCYW